MVFLFLLFSLYFFLSCHGIRYLEKAHTGNGVYGLADEHDLIHRFVIYPVYLFSSVPFSELGHLFSLHHSFLFSPTTTNTWCRCCSDSAFYISPYIMLNYRITVKKTGEELAFSCYVLSHFVFLFLESMACKAGFNRVMGQSSARFLVLLIFLFISLFFFLFFSLSFFLVIQVLLYCVHEHLSF